MLLRGLGMLWGGMGYHHHQHHRHHHHHHVKSNDREFRFELWAQRAAEIGQLTTVECGGLIMMIDGIVLEIWSLGSGSSSPKSKCKLLNPLVCFKPTQECGAFIGLQILDLCRTLGNKVGRGGYLGG